MSKPDLATVGEAFTNIAGAIAECARADVQTVPSLSHVEHFQQILDAECRRLRSAGHEGVAGALDQIRSPLSRVMTEGW